MIFADEYEPNWLASERGDPKTKKVKINQPTILSMLEKCSRVQT